ncbi:MAG: hypothetical protein ACOX86_11110 [Pelotomaculaceae bacterium]|jgi:hypothetical protein|nr:hypothetical protein [Bacillota bacterium]HHU86047.1 hypothetical protein [Peptococcaceae bacterium]
MSREQRMINGRIVTGILLLALVIGGSFLSEKVARVQGSQRGEVVPVVQNDITVAYLDAGVIRQLSIQERQLEQNRDGSGSDNEVSLSFVLGSAGLVDYEYVQATGLGDSGECRIKRGEVEGIVLYTNSNGTLSMVNKSGGNQVMIKEVARLYAAD